MPSNGGVIRAWMTRKAGEWRRFGRRNPVVRTIIVHWILGVATGLFCAGLLLGLDPLGFRSLLFRSDALVPGLALLFGGFSITFGGVVCAAAVMFPDFEEPDRDARGRAHPLGWRANPAARADRSGDARRFLSASSVRRRRSAAVDYS